jgi:hypothetical protein
MKVRISVELLADERNFEALDDIACCFQTGRHVWDISAAEIDAIESSAWLTSEFESRAGRRNRAVFEKSVKHAVEQGTAQIDGGGEPPRRCQTRPVDITPDADLSACLHELQQPARVFLEDRGSDGRFIGCLVRAYERSSLQEALEASRAWVVLEHCGGGSGIKARVEEVLERSSMMSVSRERMMAMLDSDRFHPDHETDSMKTAKKIENCGIFVHVLRKRETENYLPVERLAELDSQYQAAQAAFARLTEQQRDYFDMKNGFKRSRGKAHFRKNHPDLFASVTEQDKLALVGGFGPSCGRIFGSDIGREELDEVCSSQDEPTAECEMLELVLAIEALL